MQDVHFCFGLPTRTLFGMNLRADIDAVKSSMLAAGEVSAAAVSVFSDTTTFSGVFEGVASSCLCRSRPYWPSLALAGGWDV